jgi:microcompartment protein CcmL/EutN
MQKTSLGLIETWGHIPAIEAADAGCKAANVMLAGYEEVRAGLVTIMFLGDVAAVKTAVAAGTAAAARVGKVISSHVIARPDRQLQSLPTLPPTSKPPPETPPPPSAKAEQTHTESSSAADEKAAPAVKPWSGTEPKSAAATRPKTGGGTAKRTKRPPKA